MGPRVPRRASVAFVGTVATLLRYNRDAMNSGPLNTANHCHFCSATSYRHQIVRDHTGVLRPTNTLVCDGCGQHFESLDAWRGTSQVGKPTTQDGNFGYSR